MLFSDYQIAHWLTEQILLSGSRLLLLPWFENQIHVMLAPSLTLRWFHPGRQTPRFCDEWPVSEFLWFRDDNFWGLVPSLRYCGLIRSFWTDLNCWFDCLQLCAVWDFWISRNYVRCRFLSRSLQCDNRAHNCLMYGILIR
jgi:hypothetical protein